MISIDRLDHLVLTVASIDATAAFYAQVLGMEVIRFGEGRTALRFGDQKINLHQVGREFVPKWAAPTAGSGDLCFISSTAIPEIVAHLKDMEVEIEQGPVERSGARFPILSVYFRDPDGNLIEVSNILDAST